MLRAQVLALDCVLHSSIATDSDFDPKRRLTGGWVQRGEALWQGMAGITLAVPIPHGDAEGVPG